MTTTTKRSKTMTTQAQKMAESGYVTPHEAAERIGRAPATVRSWILDDKVEGVRVGASWYVRWQSVLDYFKQEDPRAVELLGLK